MAGEPRPSSAQTGVHIRAGPTREARLTNSAPPAPTYILEDGHDVPKVQDGQDGTVGEYYSVGRSRHPGMSI